MDLTDKWKLRVGVRQDWYDTDLDPLITVPGAFTLTQRSNRRRRAVDTQRYSR